MRLVRHAVLTASLLANSVFLPSAHAESRNPADYPLRVHIFRRSETTFYHMRQTEEAKGEGRANLFEGGEPKGIDFEFECSEKLQTSSGYETFPAKWKRPGQELVILQPQFGKPNSYDTCKLKVQLKGFAYFSRNGNLNSEPTADFKHWMLAHDYNPEHGKETPSASRQAAPANPASSSSTSPASGSDPH